MANRQLPFSTFDYLGYIIPGAVVLMGFLFHYGPVDSITKLNEFLISAGSVSIIYFIGFLILAYVVGHVVSAFGSAFFEKLIVEKCLGSPYYILLGGKHKSCKLLKIFKSCELLKKFFHEYRKPYSEFYSSEFQRVFSERYGPGYYKIDDEDKKFKEIFNLCLHDIKEESPIAYHRLEIFLRMYDFARNLSMALIIFMFPLIMKIIVQFDFWLVGLALVSILLIIAMFLRYLKFFKHYSDEVFRSFFVLRHQSKKDMTK